MRVYRHYSFDLWLTLIKSNPLFKAERTAFFLKHFNYQGKTLDEVSVIFRQVDLMCNAINEKTGKNIDADEMYLMVISMMNESADIEHLDIYWLYDEMEKLALKYLPVIYCPRTVEVIDYLKSKENTTCSILSNTGFIRGTTIRKMLQQLGILGYFDFQLFSDEAGLSKPNRDFFNLMIDTTFSRRSDCELKDILHIGDNPKADMAGALSAGIQGQLVNSNQIAITCLLC